MSELSCRSCGPDLATNRDRVDAAQAFVNGRRPFASPLANVILEVPSTNAIHQVVIRAIDRTALGQAPRPPPGSSVPPRCLLNGTPFARYPAGTMLNHQFLREATVKA